MARDIRCRLDLGAVALASPAILAVGLFFVVPVLQVLVLSFTEPSPGLDNYRMLLTGTGVQQVILRTLRLCAITTVLSVLAGYVVAYVLVGSSAMHRQVMLFFILVPFWVSALTRAFAWVVLLGREGALNSTLMSLGVIGEPLSILYNEGGVTIGMVHYMLPYAILPLFAVMRDIDPQLTAAARGLGASQRRAFFRVFLPLSMPGIVAAAALVFVYSLGFYVTPAILGGGRVLMIGEYISINVLDTVRWGFASMLASTLLVSVLLIIGVANSVSGRRVVGGAQS